MTILRLTCICSVFLRVFANLSGYQEYSNTDCMDGETTESYGLPVDCTNNCDADSQCIGFTYCTFLSSGCIKNCFYRTSSCTTFPKNGVTLYVKKVHGGWSTWGEWSTCSVTCGEGTRTRSRTCTNPSPLHGDDDCPGDTTQNDRCSMPPCYKMTSKIEVLLDNNDFTCHTISNDREPVFTVETLSSDTYQIIATHQNDPNNIRMLLTESFDIKCQRFKNCSIISGHNTQVKRFRCDCKVRKCHYVMIGTFQEDASVSGLSVM